MSPIPEHYVANDDETPAVAQKLHGEIDRTTRPFIDHFLFSQISGCEMQSVVSYAIWLHNAISQNLSRIKRFDTMTRLRVNCFSISLDGYGAGPDQDID